MQTETHLVGAGFRARAGIDKKLKEFCLTIGIAKSVMLRMILEDFMEDPVSNYSKIVKNRFEQNKLNP